MAVISENSITSVITESSRFGDLYMDITTKEAEKAGLQLGDSVDVVFGCGFEFRDIPCFNGYYAGFGNAVVCIYPGREMISVALCGGISTEKYTGSFVGDTVKVSIREKGKYTALQEAMGVRYTCRREDYSSDEVYSNFREIACVKLKPGCLYRGASPCENTYFRAACTNKVIEKNGIRTVLNLNDTDEEIEGYFKEENFCSDYYRKLYENGRVTAIRLNVNYKSESYAASVAFGLRKMFETEGPYYIHCTEGKDRTGFVCLLLLSLAGATDEEAEKDYMLSYKNYYGIVKGDPKYAALMDNQLTYMRKYLLTEQGKEFCDMGDAASLYLMQAGISEEEIQEFKKKICR